MRQGVFTILGWYGVAAIVGAYALLNFAILPADSLSYLFLNLTGSLGILAETYYRKDYQPAVVNLFWLLITLVVLVKMVM